MPAASRALLAFDTSTERMAVAACGPAGEVAWTGAGGAAASATLLREVNAVLAQAGIRLADLDAVAFGAGPGAFTGLRTACAVAQGLAFGLGRPVLPVDSLAIVAEDAPWREGMVWVAMDARIDEVYAAAYRRAGTRWQVLAAPALYTVAALAARWAADPPQRVAGSAIEAFGGRLPLGDAALHARESDRAAALLRCARQAWADGARRDPADALPVYLRDKVALTTAERARLRADRATA
ncbi:MAG: tRNA (adenosine(37)-N6)-threonylcarbamoyltransferase complex dimerization subunit type 1 TsaB [Burkholderiales bacterium]|nr:tRNA (adenosine(37)-N6)-threonylcarbamoyltransferase complex dimerization subunit type 1 TsaB [Burkholderiales bacterium]